jgi:hypothetical protein
MSKFKRVSLQGSEELFRATKPQTEGNSTTTTTATATVTETVESKPKEKHYLTVHLTPEEVDLLLEAIQAAKYPERARAKLPLFKHEFYDEIRAKLQGDRNV